MLAAKKFFVTFLLLSQCVQPIAYAYEQSDSRIGKMYWAGKRIESVFGREPKIVPRTYLALDYGTSLTVVALEQYELEEFYRVKLGSSEEAFLSVRMFEAAQQGGFIVSYDPRKRESGRIAAIKNKKWPPQIEQAAIRKQILLGMTEEQIRMSVGDPQKINRTVSARGVSEQWVYDGGYLYFENGKLTTSQDSR